MLHGAILDGSADFGLLGVSGGDDGGTRRIFGDGGGAEDEPGGDRVEDEDAILFAEDEVDILDAGVRFIAGVRGGDSGWGGYQVDGHGSFLHDGGEGGEREKKKDDDLEHSIASK